MLVATQFNEKSSAIHHTPTEKRMDYVENLIYEDGQYHFFLQDYLGNNRLVAKADDTVVQTTHYYPYGLPFAESLGAGVKLFCFSDLFK